MAEVHFSGCFLRRLQYWRAYKDSLLWNPDIEKTSMSAPVCPSHSAFDLMWQAFGLIADLPKPQPGEVGALAEQKLQS